MRPLLAVIALLSAGCGMMQNLPNPFEVIESTSNCLGPFYGPQGIKLDGEAIRSNERLLKRLFENPWTDDKGTHGALLGSDKEFCMSFGGVVITYAATSTIPCPGAGVEGPFDGCNDPHGITLSAGGYALAHELLHTYEIEQLRFDTQKHPNWEEKGFWQVGNSLTDQYAQQFLNVFPVDSLTVK